MGGGCYRCAAAGAACSAFVSCNPHPAILWPTSLLQEGTAAQVARAAAAAAAVAHGATLQAATTAAEAAARAGCSTELVAGAAVAAAGVAQKAQHVVIVGLQCGSMRPPLEPDLVCQLATLYQSSAAPTRSAFADSLLPDGSAHSELVKLAGQKEPLVRRMEAALGMPLLRLFTAAALKPKGTSVPAARKWILTYLQDKVRPALRGQGRASVGRAGQQRPAGPSQRVPRQTT